VLCLQTAAPDSSAAGGDVHGHLETAGAPRAGHAPHVEHGAQLGQ